MKKILCLGDGIMNRPIHGEMKAIGLIIQTYY